MMERVGNCASEDGSGCLIMLIMEEYPKVDVPDIGGVCVRGCDLCLRTCI